MVERQTGHSASINHKHLQVLRFIRNHLNIFVGISEYKLIIMLTMLYIC